MADDVVRSFRALPKAERLHALRQLVWTLDPHERHHVSDEISHRNDPLAALPFEIVLHVFSHIDLFAAWPLQRVCRRWQKALSSEDFLRDVTSRWETHDPSDSGLPVEEATGNSIESKVRHMQAMKLGRPHAVKVFEAPGAGGFGRRGHELELKGKRIAYISRDSHEGEAVIVRDLVTGEVRTLRGEARERLSCVVLTTSLVGFTTIDGWLYALPFVDSWDAIARVKLPSALILGFGGHEEVIALAIGGGDRGSVFEVVIYDFKTKRLRSLAIEDQVRTLGDPRNLHSCSLLVDSNKQTVDIFLLLTQFPGPPNATVQSTIDGRTLRLVHMRISFGGDVLISSSVEEPLFPHPSEIQSGRVRLNFLSLQPPQPTGYCGQYRMQVLESPGAAGVPMRLYYSAIFDATRAELRRYFEDSSRPIQHIRVHQEGDQDAEEVILAIRQWRECNHVGSIEQVFQKKPMRALWKGRLCTPHMPANWLCDTFQVNDTFQVTLEMTKAKTRMNRIRVHCYDENVHMAGHRSISWKHEDDDGYLNGEDWMEVLSRVSD